MRRALESTSFPALARVLLLTVSLAGCTVEEAPPDLSGQDVHLTILHTSDIHSRILPFNFAPNKFDQEYGDVVAQGPFGGASRLSTYLTRERERSARVLHLNSGDAFEGAPIFNVFQGEPEFRAETALGIDAAALGNHEFDRGPNVLAKQISQWAGFPILAANYIFSDFNDEGTNSLGALVHPYTIINADGMQVAVLGFGNVESLTSIVQGGNSLGITALDTGQTTDYYVNLLRPQADILIAVSHLGLDEDETDAQSTEGQQANDQDQVHGDVDVVLGGHLHIVLLPPHEIPITIQNQPTGRNTILSHSGAFAKVYGRLDLVVHMNTPAEIDTDYQNQIQQGIPFAAPHRAYVKAYDYHVNPVVARQVIDGDMCVVPDEDSSGQACVATENSNDGYCEFEMNADGSRKQCSITPASPSSPLACSQAGDTCLPCIYCHVPEDGFVENIMEPYELQLNTALDLTRVFATAAVPATISRTNYNGGDSQAGNLVATAMRTEQDVEADFAVTNSLGIRADFSAGPITLEEMFNVFPFDNTIVVLYMSGTEIQEMLNFASQVSGTRGCQTQVQISGGGFVMDCTEGVADLILIGSGRACQTSADCTVSADALAEGATNEVCGMDMGFCVDSENASQGTNAPCDFSNPQMPGACPQYQALDGAMHTQTCTGAYLPVCGKILNPQAEYRVATNNYIGNGGSGFLMLQRNTTKVDTGLSLRNALINYLQDLNDPLYEGPFQCSGTASADNCPGALTCPCHGAITCTELSEKAQDPSDPAYAYLQSVDAVPAATAEQYGCENHSDAPGNLPSVGDCFGDIICILPHNQQTDNRITPRIE